MLRVQGGRRQSQQIAIPRVDVEHGRGGRGLAQLEACAEQLLINRWFVFAEQHLAKGKQLHKTSIPLFHAFALPPLRCCFSFRSEPSATELKEDLRGGMYAE